MATAMETFRSNQRHIQSLIRENECYRNSLAKAHKQGKTYEDVLTITLKCAHAYKDSVTVDDTGITFTYDGQMRQRKFDTCLCDPNIKKYLFLTGNTKAMREMLSTMHITEAQSAYMCFRVDQVVCIQPRVNREPPKYHIKIHNAIVPLTPKHEMNDYYQVCIEHAPSHKVKMEALLGCGLEPKNNAYAQGLAMCQRQLVNSERS